MAKGQAPRPRRRLRELAEPLVVAPPAGVRVRTRLRVSPGDAAVLTMLGSHLGSLAGRDLARRCREGRLDSGERGASRRDRKRELTRLSSSRWAGAITRVSEDQWQLGYRSLVGEARSLRRRIDRIGARLGVPVGSGRGGLRGYPDRAERYQKQRRLQVLRGRLRGVEERLAASRVSLCRGGRRNLHRRHHLAALGVTAEEWRAGWQASRLFLCADGERDKAWGNETIRFQPQEGWLELKLPGAMARLANRPHGRYRLSGAVSFPYRGGEVATQAGRGAIRYDVSLDPERGRWYLDASWRLAGATRSLGELRRRPVLAVGLNSDHLAGWVVDRSGNPVGAPLTLPLALQGRRATTRDGRLRAALATLLRRAQDQGCGAVCLEDLDFAESREEGREHKGRRPRRGRRGRGFRRLVSGLPTARSRHRLVGMASRRGISVVATDPAYSSRWGREHWLRLLQDSHGTGVTGHHAAALVLGRRGLGLRARRRGLPRGAGRDSRRPEDLPERAAGSPVPRSDVPKRETGDRQARGQPPRGWPKTPPANRPPPATQVPQDRPGSPGGQESLLSVAKERWPDDEAVETLLLTEDRGVTALTDILEFKAPENLGDHFQANDGAQASWDKLDDLLTNLREGRS